MPNTITDTFNYKDIVENLQSLRRVSNTLIFSVVIAVIFWIGSQIPLFPGPVQRFYTVFIGFPIFIQVFMQIEKDIRGNMSTLNSGAMTIIVIPFAMYLLLSGAQTVNEPVTTVLGFVYGMASLLLLFAIFMGFYDTNKTFTYNLITAVPLTVITFLTVIGATTLAYTLYTDPIHIINHPIITVLFGNIANLL